jgi:uncharacterized protein involved in type VI secretion and phage assembly
MTTIVLSPKVSIGGSALSTTWQAALLELRVERALNVPARVTLRFADPGYVLLKSGIVSITGTLQVTGPGGDHTLFTGIVTSVGAEQREGEQPELVVVGHDKSYKLGLNSQVKTWITHSYADVLHSLLSTSSSGLSATAGPSASSPVLTYVLQVDTDLGMLGEMARRAGADWWVDGTTLYFGKPSELTSNRTTVKLTLGDGLFAFSARAFPAPASVSVTGWNTVTQQAVTGQASSASSGVSPTSTLASMASAMGTFVTGAHGARSSTEASTLSQALFDLREAAAVEATGTAAGNGTMAPGGKVTVSGAGPLSGTYPITAVEHVYRPRRGYITRFRSGDRRPAGLVDGGRGNAESITGSIVGHYGVTAGIVTNIKDPTSLGRVKVQFPGLSASQESAWARVVAMGGGGTHGNVFLPEVNDEVLVAFEDGDTRTPVVIGGLYGKTKSMPGPFATVVDSGSGTVVKREIRSRLGHTICFLDGTSTDKKAIELALADGTNKIHFGSDKTTVTVKSGKNLAIKVGTTSITVAAGNGALTIQAATITIQAKSQLQLKGATVSISADDALTMKGSATATLTGGASLKVKASGEVGITGAIVQINA